MIALTIATLALAGCGTSNTTSQVPAPAGSTPAATSPAATFDAKTVLAKLTAAGLGITRGVVQDENSDPNNLIGRPHQYTSRASFDLPGGDTSAEPGDIDRGGVIECFATAEDAAARLKYLDAVTGSSAMFAEYYYLHGTVIVRLAKGVKPTLAAKIQAAVEAL